MAIALFPSCRFSVFPHGSGSTNRLVRGRIVSTGMKKAGKIFFFKFPMHMISRLFPPGRVNPGSWQKSSAGNGGYGGLHRRIIF
jgi:hypothetical protein